jgi:anti-sigma28 factor (negative regulator of flagellin synthesis)
MKIDDRISNYMALLNSEAAKPAAPAGHEPVTQTVVEAAPVAVDLSPTAIQLADDEARRKRLEIIRQQLAEGSYNISGKDVADKMLKILKG